MSLVATPALDSGVAGSRAGALGSTRHIASACRLSIAAPVAGALPLATRRGQLVTLMAKRVVVRYNEGGRPRTRVSHHSHPSYRYSLPSQLCHVSRARCVSGPALCLHPLCSTCARGDRLSGLRKQAPRGRPRWMLSWAGIDPCSGEALRRGYSSGGQRARNQAAC